MSHIERNESIFIKFGKDLTHKIKLGVRSKKKGDIALKGIIHVTLLKIMNYKTHKWILHNSLFVPFLKHDTVQGAIENQIIKKCL